MQAKNRVNGLGQRYELMELSGGRTRIRTGQKEIIVNHDIEKLSQGWYLWNNGYFIQDAFPYLTRDEREFIQTGITVEEWMAIFPPICKCDGLTVMTNGKPICSKCGKLQEN